MAPDWKSSIPLFSKIQDPELRAWSFIIHSKWQTLLRQHNVSNLCQGCVSSLLPLKYPFVIPGGRFREFYYWDTLWILHGLLISEMYDTAKGILLNFLDIVSVLGFVPNGSRIYYLNRSQPPVLTQMVRLYVEKTGDVELLKQALPLLDKEYFFWMNFRSVSLRPPDADGVDSATNATSQYVLNRYYVDSHHPRPESHLEDIHLARSFQTEQEKVEFFKNVATAAESGWDFSSRWFRGPKYSTSSLVALKKQAQDSHTNLEGYLESLDSFSFEDIEQLPEDLWSFKEPSQHSDPAELSDLCSIDIVNLLPLDLNCILFANERILEKLHRYYGENVQMADYYKTAYRSRFAAMKKFLFDPQTNRWADFNITSGTLRDSIGSAGQNPASSSRNLENPDEEEMRNPYFYISDFSPVWYFDDNDGASTSRLFRSFGIKEDPDDIEFYKEVLSFKNTQLDVIKSFLFDDKGNMKEYILSSDAHLASAKDAAYFNDKKGIWKYSGGIPTSEVISGHQWDFPNAWAPFQYYLIETLLKLCRTPVADGSAEYVYDKSDVHYRQALEIATRWIRSTYCGWHRTNQFYEKYNAQRPGEAGFGGEYIVQEGFGWTNAVILMILDQFGDELAVPTDCPSYREELHTTSSSTTKKSSGRNFANIVPRIYKTLAWAARL